MFNIDGEEIGYHNGAVFYTLGERHGFTVTKKNSTDGPYYIVAKDVKKNILFVSQEKKTLDFLPLLHPADGTFRQQNPKFFSLKIDNTNWISEVPKLNKNYTAQIRYHGEFFSCRIKSISKDKAEIIFKKPVSVASGQSCVVYNGEVCLGGGVVV